MIPTKSYWGNLHLQEFRANRSSFNGEDPGKIVEVISHRLADKNVSWFMMVLEVLKTTPNTTHLTDILNNTCEKNFRQYSQYS